MKGIDARNVENLVCSEESQSSTKGVFNSTGEDGRTQIRDTSLCSALALIVLMRSNSSCPSGVGEKDVFCGRLSRHQRERGK